MKTLKVGMSPLHLNITIGIDHIEKLLSFFTRIASTTRNECMYQFTSSSSFLICCSSGCSTYGTALSMLYLILCWSCQLSLFARIKKFHVVPTGSAIILSKAASSLFFKDSISFAEWPRSWWPISLKHEK